MKSRAHPEWPYAGSAHEWRGFVKRAETFDFSKVEIDSNFYFTWPADAHQKQNTEWPGLTCPQCYRDAEQLTELGHCFRCEERQARREIGTEFHKLNFGELTWYPNGPSLHLFSRSS
jgi:hypothetical protein